MAKLLNCIADDSKWLYNQYINNHKSISLISREIGVSRSAIEDRLFKFKISQRESWKKKHNRLIRNKDKIIYLYVIEDLTTKEIADRFGLEGTCIADLLRLEGVLKSPGEKLIGKYTGSLASNWRGGTTKLGQLIRSNVKNRNFIKSIMLRDDYTCQDCDKRGGNLEVHHIILFSDILIENNITSLNKALKCKKLWDVTNGITLCVKCHKKRHKHPKEI